MSDDKIKSPVNVAECGECGEPIIFGQLAVIYDGEPCHIDCAADAEDAIGFDDFFGANG